MERCPIRFPGGTGEVCDDLRTTVSASLGLVAGERQLLSRHTLRVSGDPRYLGEGSSEVRRVRPRLLESNI